MSKIWLRRILGISRLTGVYYKLFSPRSTILSFIGAIPQVEEPIRVGRRTVCEGTPRIGRYTFIANNVTLGRNLVAIGRYCSIGPGARIALTNHPLETFSTSSAFYSKLWGAPNDFRQEFNGNEKTTIIEHDVWIGENAIIMSGVKVAIGTVVGAGAVLTKSTQPYSIWAGNPARQIRKRFSDSEVTELLSSEWWEKPIEELRSQWIRDYGNTLEEKPLEIPVKRL